MASTASSQPPRADSTATTNNPTASASPTLPTPAPAPPSHLPSASEEEVNSRHLFFLSQRDLPPLPDTSMHVWNKQNEKQLRSALIGACKRMPKNAEAHFHLGLMYMRNGDFQPALRSFQHARNLSVERVSHYHNNNLEPPPALKSQVARVRSHCAQAAHLVALAMERDKHADILLKTQRELIASIKHDCTSPDAWNALGLVHLNEGGSSGAKDVFQTIRQSFPDYLDALNNVGVAELALGNEEIAVSCFQKVLLCDREHVEALSNYAVVLLRHGMYDAAIRAFNAATKGAPPEARGLPFAWGGLAIAHAALGQLDAADLAARRAETSAAVSNRPRFSMLRASIYVRRVADAFRRGLAWDSVAAAFIPHDRQQPTSPEGAEASDGGSHSGDVEAGDRDDVSDGEATTGNANAKANGDADDHQQNGEEIKRENNINTSNSNNGNVKKDVQKTLGDSSVVVNAGNIPSSSASKQGALSFLDPSSTLQFPTAPSTIPSSIPSFPMQTDTEDADPRPAIDGAVLRLRALARELRTSSASTALGAALRLRHHYGTEDTNNRNFGAEAAERLVEALEMDHNDATAWVQLSLLQLSTGEYTSAKDFSIQAVSRNGNVEAGWNALAVASQLHDDAVDAATAYETALSVIRANYSKNDRWPRPQGNSGNRNGGEGTGGGGDKIDGEEIEGNGEIKDKTEEGEDKEKDKDKEKEGRGVKRPPNPVRRLVFPLTEVDGNSSIAIDQEQSGTITTGATSAKEINGRTQPPSSTVGSTPMEVDERRTSTASGETILENDMKTEDKIVADEDLDVLQLNMAGRNALAAVYNNLGNLRRQEGADFTEVLTAYQKSLKVGGENSVVYNNLALLYISSNRLDDASRMLDHALKLDPKLDCAISNRLKLTALVQKRASPSEDDDGVYDDFGAFGNDVGDDMIGVGEQQQLGVEEDDEEEEEDDDDDGEEDRRDDHDVNVDDDDVMDLGEDYGGEEDEREHVGDRNDNDEDDMNLEHGDDHQTEDVEL